MTTVVRFRRYGFGRRKFASLERRTHPSMPDAAASASSASVRSMGAAMAAKKRFARKGR
jgi:hypothetical protein